jgi:hypothetical protein
MLVKLIEERDRLAKVRHGPHPLEILLLQIKKLVNTHGSL